MYDYDFFLTANIRLLLPHRGKHNSNTTPPAAPTAGAAGVSTSRDRKSAFTQDKRSCFEGHSKLGRDSPPSKRRPASLSPAGNHTSAGQPAYTECSHWWEKVLGRGNISRADKNHHHQIITFTAKEKGGDDEACRGGTQRCSRCVRLVVTGCYQLQGLLQFTYSDSR